MFIDEMISEISDTYWEEEREFELGIHPTQIKERIESRLKILHIDYKEITMLDLLIGNKVEIYLDDKKFGIFDYEKNIFTKIY